MVNDYRTAWVLLILLCTGCNAFAPFDQPSGDVAVLSAARACFDLGDFQCAAEKYRILELSTSSTITNQAYSEDAFEILAQNGVTFAVFMEIVLASNGNAGTLITQLAGVLRTNAATNPLRTALYPVRTALFGAYQKSLKITDDRSRGLLKFITATTLLAEILGEDANGVDTTKNTGKLLQSDLVADPTTCLASAGIAPWTGCTVPTGASIVDGTVAINLTTATTLTGIPNLEMILAASSEMQSGLLLMTSAAGIGSAAATLVNRILAQTIGVPVGSPLFRYTLLKVGIGTN
jgi:hypothetical protein